MISDYDTIVGLIYDGITDETAWHSALAAVADLAVAAGVGLGMQDMLTHEFREFGSVGIDRSLHATYLRLAPTNTIWREIARRREPLADEMVMPKSDFVRTELFADWFAPQGFHSVMAAPTLFAANASAVLVAFGSRSRGDFAGADLGVLLRFAQHFGRALAIQMDREQAAQELAVANRLLDDLREAVLLVGYDARLKYANRAARILLDRGSLIRLHQNRFELVDPRADARLKQLFADGRAGELEVAGEELSRAIVRVNPWAYGEAEHFRRDTTIKIFALDQHQDALNASRLQERLRLTKRQSDVIAELAAGRTEAEAAQRLGLGESTLHTHVRHIYERLDVKTRAELIALLARYGFHISVDF